LFQVIPRDLDIKGSKLITGFHGIGATGYWTVKYLIQKLDAKRVAFIDSDLMPPVSATFSGKLVTPYELYRKDEIIFLKIDIPVLRENEVAFYRDLADWVASSGFSEAALIGGLDSNLRVDDSTHRVVFTSNFIPRPPLNNSKILEDDHIIVGPVAALLNRFEILGFPAYAILAYASTERVDPRAASAAIDVLSSLYGFNVDTSPLIKGAEALEEQTQRGERISDRYQKQSSMYT
jgi:predicted ATP-grasp superfamily ATP-dependent carboligase